MKNWPFKVIDKGNKPFIQVQYKGQTKTISPMEISSMILTKMKEIAEDYLGKPVKEAVISCPATFTCCQRNALIDAATVSGLRVRSLITDTSATAFAYSYCLNKHKGGEKNILIFSLGGGVFSVSLVAMEDGVFEVKATSGDLCLGGEDFDSRMVDYLGKCLSFSMKTLIS